MSSKFKRTVEHFGRTFGVKNQKNREQNFEAGYAGWLILVGIIYTLMSVATVFTAVKIVTS